MDDLAAAFDMTVPQLTMPLPSDEELKQAIHQMNERYRITPLRPIEQATHLHAVMGLDA